MQNPLILILFFFLACSGFFPLPASAEVSGRYLYTLSDFSGPEPFSWVKVRANNGETFVVNPGDQTVRVFNGSGMEIYHFGDDGALGTINDIAVADSGDIYVLSGTGSSFRVTRCNYRGEPINVMTWQGFPAEFTAGFAPDAIFARGESLFLADRGGMKVAVTDQRGRFENGYDLASLIGADKKKGQEANIFGLSVDRNRNILFTVPTTFTAYVITPERKVLGFGEKGGRPGKFNIVSGITADEQGNLYLVDTLRCVVMVFDKNLEFQTEFGFRGLAPGNLIAPRELAYDAGMLYVTQARGRGVSVYRVAAD